MDDLSPREYKKLRLFIPLKQSLFFGGVLAENWPPTLNLAFHAKISHNKVFSIREKAVTLYVIINIYDYNNIIYIIFIKIKLLK